MVAAVNNLAIVLAVFAAAMLSVAVTGLAMGEGDAAGRFFTIAMITAFVSGSVFFASHRPSERKKSSARFLFVILAWLVPPVFAAFPLLSASGDYLSALVEAISGITTTGATVFSEVAALSRSDLLWRAELHWLGGLLTLVLIVTVLAPAGVGGIPDGHTAADRRVASGDGARQWVLIRDLLLGYAGLTVVFAFGLTLAQIPIFDAVCLAMSAVSTGGFMPNDNGLAAYGSPAAEWLIAAAVLIGGTSILWHRMVLLGRWRALREHRESYWIIGMAIAVGLAFAAVLAPDSAGWGTALRHGLVTGASLVSTSGMEVHNGGFFALPLPVVLLVALVGGGAFSTAGGLRVFRIGGMLVESIKETRRLIYPHGIQPRLLGAREFEIRVMKAIWSLFAASIAVVALAALGVALAGVEFGGAAAAAVSAFANVGGVYTSSWAEAASWPSFGEMPVAAQLLLAGVMILGRVEIVVVVIAITLVAKKA